MAGCIECGRRTQKARCEMHRVEHNAATDHAVGECPECGGETIPDGVRCQDCLGGSA